MLAMTERDWLSAIHFTQVEGGISSDIQHGTTITNKVYWKNFPASPQSHPKQTKRNAPVMRDFDP